MSDPPEFYKLFILQKRSCLIGSRSLVRLSADMEFVRSDFIQADLFLIFSGILCNFMPRCLFPVLYSQSLRFTRHVSLYLTSVGSVPSRISLMISHSHKISMKSKTRELISVSVVDDAVHVCFFNRQCTIQSLYFIMISLVDLLSSLSPA